MQEICILCAESTAIILTFHTFASFKKWFWLKIFLCKISFGCYNTTLGNIILLLLISKEWFIRLGCCFHLRDWSKITCLYTF
jgi:hypothetical protein